MFGAKNTESDTDSLKHTSLLFNHCFVALRDHRLLSD
jgi:hypothetical protein